MSKRKILFRGKHIHAIDSNEHLNGRWVHGYLSDKNYIHDEHLEGEFLIDEDTICQYTGLTDKNGKKIWENDIVQAGRYKGTVEYKDGCFVIKWYNVKFLRKDLGYWADLDGFHTVGNIYDNPELLEEENVHGTD